MGTTHPLQQSTHGHDSSPFLFLKRGRAAPTNQPPKKGTSRAHNHIACWTMSTTNRIAVASPNSTRQKRSARALYDGTERKNPYKTAQEDPHHSSREHSNHEIRKNRARPNDIHAGHARHTHVVRQPLPLTKGARAPHAAVAAHEARAPPSRED